jgi:DNA repair protein RecN (Recombination protein N)
VLAQLDDVAGELTAYLDRLDADPERLARVLGRQAELKALTRKYAADTDGVLAWAQQARSGWSTSTPRTRRWRALAARRDALAAELAGHAAAGHRGAHAAAARLADGTTAELGGLAMPDARLLVAVTPRRGRAGRSDALPVGARRSRRARTASTRSSCGWSPTRVRRRSRCTRAPRAGSCRG